MTPADSRREPPHEPPRTDLITLALRELVSKFYADTDWQTLTREQARALAVALLSAAREGR